MRLPYIKFFVRDWISDTQLRIVSIGARGLWLELLCIMQGANRRGYLETPSGSKINNEQLVSLCGTTREEFEKYRIELLANGIPSVDDDGIWYSRRMVRDENKSEKCREAGKEGGGSPLLKKEKVTPKERNTNTEEYHTHSHSHISLKVPFKGDLYTSDFQEFWKSYPKKVGKGAAYAAWRRVKNRPIVDVLIESVKKSMRTEQWQKSNGQFIPNPATWLNQARWHDEPDTFGTEGAGKSRFD
jgi:hypothetical protein